MMSGLRAGSSISLDVIEPWTLGGRVLLARILAVALDPDGACRRVTVELLEPLMVEGSRYAFFVMVPRSADSLDPLLDGLDCCLTNVDPRGGVSTEVPDPASWRGGLALLATVTQRVAETQIR